MDASAPVLLRPLGIGEIIDRALSLYVRNFVTFTSTVLIVIFVPLAFSQYFLLDAQSGEFQSIFNVLRHAASGTTATPTVQSLQAMISYPELFVGYALELATIVLLPFAFNSVAASVGAIYTGRKPSVGASLATTFSRWTQLLGRLAFAFLAIAGAYLILVILGVGTVFGAIAVATAFPGVAHSPIVVAAIVLVVIAAIAAFCVVGGLVAVAMAFAGYAVVLERRGVMASLASGFERVFNRKEWGKAFVVVIVALLVAWGIAMLSAFAEMIVLFVPGLQAIAALLSTLIAVLSYTVQTVFYSVYYYDVRIRREGLDLEMALQRLGASTGP